MNGAATMRRAAGAMVVVVAAAMVAACSGTDAGGAGFTVGAGNSPQSEVLAHIYAEVLARSGMPTTVASGLGQRADYLSALDAGAVQLVGDQSGDLLSAFESGSTARFPDRATADADTTARDTTGTLPGSSPADAASGAGDGPGVAEVSTEPRPDVSDSVNRALPDGLGAADVATGADLRPSLALSPASAAVFPDSLSKLAGRCGELTVGIAAGSELDPLRRSPDPQRDVLEPLHRVYGCDITRSTVYPNDSALRDALRDEKVRAGVFTASTTLLPDSGAGLTPVVDPGYAFPARSVLPLFRKGTVGAEQIKMLNNVAGELTTGELAALVRQLRDDHVPAAELAGRWLDDHDL